VESLYTRQCNGGLIENCVCYNNPGGPGIRIDHNSNDIMIANCEAYGNTGGIVFLQGSYENVVINCLLHNNNMGITFPKNGHDNLVMNCEIYNNIDGIKFYSNAGDENIIKENSIFANEVGVNITEGYDNIFFYNNFYDNGINAIDQCDNTWHNTVLEEGNYWDDYTGVDVAPADGIGDTPYNISGGNNKDMYPLTIPYGGNHPPFAADDYETTNEETPITINVLANDTDLNGDTILLDAFDPTSIQGGSITLDDNGTPADTSDDQLIYTPPKDFYSPPTDIFTYTITDGTTTDNATVHITVNNINDAPVTSQPVGLTSLSIYIYCNRP